MINLNGISKVKLNDYTDYNPEKCNNGGCYGFWTDYDRQEDSDTWRISYYTTADFSYCPVCGSFNDHLTYDEDLDDYEYSCGDYKTVTTEELIKILEEFEEDEGCYIETF